MGEEMKPRERGASGSYAYHRARGETWRRRQGACERRRSLSRSMPRKSLSSLGLTTAMAQQHPRSQPCWRCGEKGMRNLVTGDEVAQIDISREEVDKLAAEVMGYVIFNTHQTSGFPIKREELILIVTKKFRQRAPGSSIVFRQCGCEELSSGKLDPEVCSSTLDMNEMTGLK